MAIHTRKISEISSIISFRQETVIQIHFDRIVVMNIENLFVYNLYLLFKCNNTEPLIAAFAKKVIIIIIIIIRHEISWYEPTRAGRIDTYPVVDGWKIAVRHFGQTESKSTKNLWNFRSVVSVIYIYSNSLAQL